MLGKFAVKASRFGKDCTGVFFRRTREDLKEAIERSAQIYGPIGAKWYEQKKWWRFPNGARLKFEYLDRDADANNYQGHSYTDLFFEEITHWPDPAPINKLRATLRSAAGVPCQFHATGNPGGPGHQWVKGRYIDPAPSGWELFWSDFVNPFTGEKTRKNRIFIPSKLSDNRYLGSEYVANLQQSGSETLVKAWLAGDWSVVEGAFFDCWKTEKHVIRPFSIPDSWLRFRSMDWGSASPFSVGWWAVAGEDHQPFGAREGRGFGGVEGYPAGGLSLPRGALVRYREWYGASAPGVGLKLTAEEVADGIKAREASDRGKDGRSLISYGVLDPSAFAQDGGPSIAERMFSRGVTFRPADNKRVSQRGAMGGWDQMRARMKGDGERPALFVFSTCTDFIRTVPVLQHDPDRPEDLDTNAEDHVADEARYACSSRPYVRVVPEEKKPVFEYQGKNGLIVSGMTFNQLRDRNARRRERE